MHSVVSQQIETYPVAIMLFFCVAFFAVEDIYVMDICFRETVVQSLVLNFWSLTVLKPFKTWRHRRFSPSFPLISYVHTIREMTDTRISSMISSRSSLKLFVRVIQWWAAMNFLTGFFFCSQDCSKHKGCHCFSLCVCNWILLTLWAFCPRNVVYVLWLM